MKQWLLIILVLTILQLHVCGQTFTVSRLSTRDGLPNNVTAMCQDKEGYIWMNSYKWLTRYDGYSFVKYPLDNEGFDNHFVEDDVLWFYKDSLVKKVTFHNGAFKVFEFRDKKRIAAVRRMGSKYLYRGSVLKKYGINQNFIFRNKHYLHYIKCKNRFVMIATYGNGLFIYNPKTGKTQHFDASDPKQHLINTNNLLAIMQDRPGTVWISQEYMGMLCLKFESSGAERIRIENVGYDSPVNNVRALSLSPEGKVYVGNMQGTVYEYNEKDNYFNVVFKQGSRIYSIFIDRKGRLWIGTRGNGLFVIDGKRKWHFLKELPSRHVYDIVQDRQGTIWIACFDGGLVRCQENGSEKFHFKRIGNIYNPQNEMFPKNT